MTEEAVAQNWFATVAILAWPIVAVWLYSTRPVNQATLWTILGAYLLLPHRALIKVAPGIPQLDKTSIAGFAALIGCIFIARRPLWRLKKFGFTEVLLIMLLISPFVTSELNTDPVRAGLTTLPSLDDYEALSAVVAQLLLILPFFIGRQLLRTPTDNEELLRVLVIAGLLYSLPMLFELKMSPQLHYWIYGYYATDFIQAMRWGGFRPVVFVGHGLGVAFFTMTAAMAAVALSRTQSRVWRLTPKGVAAYLCTMAVLCKSLSTLVFGAISIPLVGWATPRLQMRVALFLVGLALLYPLLRVSDYFPVNTIVDTADFISTERAGSMKLRFDQEQQLMDRAMERPLFGWGRFGRSRVYDEYGYDMSVTDGRWIITLGQFGLFGFLAEFGLLTFPVFMAASARKFARSRQEELYLAVLSLILAINIVDLLPNAALTPWTWLVAGALLGRVELLRSRAVQRPQSEAAFKSRKIEPQPSS